MTLDTAESARPPRLIGCSLVLGLVFAAAWMGFAAVRARDGRRPVTDWLDPLLAGTTLLVTLGALAALAIMWHRLPGPRFRIVLATVLIAAEWTYVAGEVLSNTITIGEPPADVGSLLEIVAGGATVLGSSSWPVRCRAWPGGSTASPPRPLPSPR